MPATKRVARLAVHKFSSCDGCQVALLSLGVGLLSLAKSVRIIHFAEFGVVDEEAEVDIALVEGSVSTEAEIERIRMVRERSRWLVAVGACATSGGIQALRNLDDADRWAAETYTVPERLGLATEVAPLAAHVRVDLELWGCPVTTEQVSSAVRHLQRGAVPGQDSAAVCLECKRSGQVCVMVTGGRPCMGPVTRRGCGAVCPAVGRDCYACGGPAENANPTSMARRLVALDMPAERAAQRFVGIHSRVQTFRVGAAAARTLAPDPATEVGTTSDE